MVQVARRNWVTKFVKSWMLWRVSSLACGSFLISPRQEIKKRRKEQTKKQYAITVSLWLSHNHGISQYQQKLNCSMNADCTFFKPLFSGNTAILLPRICQCGHCKLLFISCFDGKALTTEDTCNVHLWDREFQCTTIILSPAGFALNSYHYPQTHFKKNR